MTYKQACDLAYEVYIDCGRFCDVGDVGVVGDEGEDNWRVLLYREDDSLTVVEKYERNLAKVVERPSRPDRYAEA